MFNLLKNFLKPANSPQMLNQPVVNQLASANINLPSAGATQGTISSTPNLQCRTVTSSGTSSGTITLNTHLPSGTIVTLPAVNGNLSGGSINNITITGQGMNYSSAMGVQSVAIGYNSNSISLGHPIQMGSGIGHSGQFLNSNGLWHSLYDTDVTAYLNFVEASIRKNFPDISDNTRDSIIGMLSCLSSDELNSIINEQNFISELQSVQDEKEEDILDCLR